jgi:hypothetical protein
MKATDIVRGALEMSDYLTNKMLEDMRDAPLTQPCVIPDGYRRDESS